MLTNANGLASYVGDSGLFRISANSRRSSLSTPNCGFVLLITSFQSHLGTRLTENLPLEDEGVCSTTSFPLSLLLRVLSSLYEDSSSTISILVEPKAYTSVSWEGGWEYSSICHSFDTSSVTTCSSSSSCNGSFWTFSSIELWGRGVIEPLSTTVTCGSDGGVRSGPYESDNICA